MPESLNRWRYSIGEGVELHCIVGREKRYIKVELATPVMLSVESARRTLDEAQRERCRDACITS